MYQLTRDQKIENLLEIEQKINQKIQNLEKQRDGVRKKIERLKSQTTISTSGSCLDRLERLRESHSTTRI